MSAIEPTSNIKTTYSQSLLDLVAIIYSPTLTFKKIDANYRIRWVILCLFIIHASFYYFVSNRLISTNEIQTLLHQGEIVIPTLATQRLKIVITFFSTGIYFITVLVSHLALYVVSQVFKTTIQKKMLFAIVLISQGPVLIGKISKLFYTYHQSSTTEIASSQSITSLGLLASQFSQNQTLIKVLSGVDLMEIWTYSLIGLGIATVASSSLKKGLLTAFTVWLIIFIINASVVIAIA
ncbi:YIP1 family protein [Paenibacillus planticolens]|uniref:Yip1 domain-containing protein n=1 Tax=Paenibacillus planticolens TaxID=2654976 RepID=A0ABX1ZK48_9BACL|nr:YIP1 family protein [Paenibacillus planticolens]NOV00366.1 hypothetical protein [Paenibacillus planticolens]